MYYIINCQCGYKYYFDHETNKWIIEGSKYKFTPNTISDDLNLTACPECGIVYYDKYSI